MIEIPIKINFRTKRPISEQVQEGLRKLIRDNLLQPGDQLPTVRNLAKRLNVNFNTIARVYRLLDEEGLISTQQGRGTYVLEQETLEEAETLTREETIRQMVNKLISEAEQRDISQEEVYKVILEMTDEKKAGSLTRLRRKGKLHHTQHMHTRPRDFLWANPHLPAKKNLRKVYPIKKHS